MTLFSLQPEGHSQEKLHTSETATLQFDMFLVKTCLRAVIYIQHLPFTLYLTIYPLGYYDRICRNGRN